MTKYRLRRLVMSASKLPPELLLIQANSFLVKLKIEALPEAGVWHVVCIYQGNGA
jgi:hypothetical protein